MQEADGSQDESTNGRVAEGNINSIRAPFHLLQVDYFGPSLVKRGRGRVIEKHWGATFVCMNSRAVHLELAKSLATDDFMFVLMRFLNRRGHAKEVRSDNRSNFVCADNVIQDSTRSWNTARWKERSRIQGVSEFFIPLAHLICRECGRG